MRSKTSIIFDPTLRKEGWSYHAAVFVSYLVNPVLLPPLAIALILAHLGASGTEIAMMTVSATIFFGVIPVAYVLKMVRDGETDSLDVPLKEDRMRPMFVAVGSYVVATGILWLQSLTATTFITALVGMNVLNGLILVAINRLWKISLHMIVLGGFISVLFFAALYEPGMLGGSSGPFSLTAQGVLPLAVLVPLLMWARVRVGAHTIPQVMAGSAFGLIVPFSELYLFTKLVLVP